LSEISNTDSNLQSASPTIRERRGLEAIILAGGLGTRLRSVVSDVPKCMAPVNGTPFLTFIINDLIKQGIERFIFSLGYKSESIIDFAEAQYKNLDKVYVIEKEPLGTGGAIKKACKEVQGEKVLVLNGDTLFDIDVQELADIHVKQKAQCTIALKPMTNFSRYGSVETNSNAMVTAFNEKQFCKKGLINGGIYVLNAKQFLQQPLPEIFSFEKEYLEKNINTHHLNGIAFDDYFIDIGIPEDYEKAQQELGIRN
jgi:D-glycero-alpha-D-manno-heptose 1-phosphate guanylyltransferase